MCVRAVYVCVRAVCVLVCVCVCVCVCRGTQFTSYVGHTERIFVADFLPDSGPSICHVRRKAREVLGPDQRATSWKTRSDE